MIRTRPVSRLGQDVKGYRNMAQLAKEKHLPKDEQQVTTIKYQLSPDSVRNVTCSFRVLQFRISMCPSIVTIYVGEFLTQFNDTCEHMCYLGEYFIAR